MRKFLTICAILLSLSASAQWQLTGSRVRYVNGIGIPTRDTSAMTPADSSQILIRPADSALYVRYKRAWMRVGGGGGSIAGSGTTNYVPKFTSSTAIGNSQIFDDGTSVGIGTIPSSWRSGARAIQFGANGFGALWEQGSGAVDLSFASYESATNTFLYKTTGDLPTLYQQVTGNHAWYNALSGTAGNPITWSERMRITSGGDVGIGTTSPANKLDVFATNRTALNTTGSGVNVNYSGTTTGEYATIGFSWANSIGNNSTQWGMGMVGTNFASGTGALTFFTNGNDRMRITSAGDVGIGTASPGSRLDVSGTATATNLSVTTNATVGGTLRVTGTTTLGTTNTGAITASSIDAGTGNGAFGNVYSNGIVQMLGVNVKYRNISATYTATTSDDYFINITSGTFTLNLPTAATPYGQVYVIKNSGTGTVTVDPNGSQTIDGATTFTMNVQNGSITIIGDGSNWKIVSKYL